MCGTTFVARFYLVVAVVATCIVDTYNLVVACDSDVRECEIIARVSWVNRNDACGRNGIQCTSGVVEDIDVCSTVCLVGEHECRVSVLDSTFDGTFDACSEIHYVQCLHIELLWYGSVCRLLWIWIIFEVSVRIYPTFSFQEDERIGSLVCFNLYGLVFAVERFVSFHSSHQFVCTRLQVREVEETVVVLVHSIGRDFFACLCAQCNHSAVERSPLVVGISSPLEHLVCEALVLIFHSTKDITFFLWLSLVEVHNTAVVADTLLLAIVAVECAVASRLIGVEESLYEEARNTMVQYTEVTCISLTT